MILVSGDPIKCNNGPKYDYGVDVTTSYYQVHTLSSKGLQKGYLFIAIIPNLTPYSRSHMAPSPSAPSPDLPDESGAPLLPRFSQEEEAVSLSLIPIFLHLISTSPHVADRCPSLFLSPVRS